MHVSSSSYACILLLICMYPSPHMHVSSSYACILLLICMYPPPHMQAFKFGDKKLFSVFGETIGVCVCVCVCVCVYMHVCINIYTHTYISVLGETIGAYTHCIRTCILLLICMYPPPHMHVSSSYHWCVHTLYTYMYPPPHMHVSSSSYACILLLICMYPPHTIGAYTHCIHTYAHHDTCMRGGGYMHAYPHCIHTYMHQCIHALS